MFSSFLNNACVFPSISSYIAGESNTEVSCYVLLSRIIFADVFHYTCTVGECHASIGPILGAHFLQVLDVNSVLDQATFVHTLPFSSSSVNMITA